MREQTRDNLTLYRLRVILALYWVTLCILTHWPRLGTGVGYPYTLIQHDKVGHVVLFGGLALLLMAAKPWGRALSPAVTAVLAMVTALIYSVVDEWTQAWFDRTVSWPDVMSSMAGIMIVYLLAVAVDHSPGQGRATRSATPAPTLLGWLLREQAIVLSVALVVLTCMISMTTPGRQGVAAWAAEVDLNPSRTLAAVRTVLSVLMFITLMLAKPAGRGRATWNTAIAIAVTGLLPLIGEWFHSLWTSQRVVAQVAWEHERGLILIMLAWGMAHALRLSWKINRAASASRNDNTHDVSTTRSATAFVSDARLFSGITLVSRLTGLVRDAALAAVFGLSTIADAFFIGFLVPNLFRRLFGEGALSAAFIPHYTQLRQEAPDLARRFAWSVLTLLSAGLCVVTIVGELGLWVLLQTMQPGGKGELAVWLMMWMLPYMPMVCIVAMLGGVLQVHRKFGPPAAAPLVLNGCMIAAAWWAAWHHGAHGEVGAAFVLAVSVVVAGVLQLIWQGWEVLRRVPWFRTFRGTWPTMRSMLLMMGPMTLGLGVYQLNALLDSIIAFVLSPSSVGAATTFEALGYVIAYPIEIGGVAAVQWSQRLYQFPLGVFGIAIATAVFPALAAAVARHRRIDGIEILDPDQLKRERERTQPRADEAMASAEAEPSSPSSPEADIELEAEDDDKAVFGEILRQGLRLTMFIGLPAAAGLVVMREPVVQLVYQRGQFNAGDTLRVATVLGWYAIGIWAYSATHVLTRAFYAFKDARTPLMISLRTVGLNFALNLTLIWFMGIAGLALSTAISATVQVVLLSRAMRSRVDRLFDRTLWISWLNTAALTAAMVTVLLPLVFFVDTSGMGLVALLAWVLVLIAVGAGIFAAGAWWRGCEELRWVLRR